MSKDLDGIVQSWNPAAERIFGYTAEEMVGESIRRIIPEHLQGEEDEVLRRLRAGERIDHFETIRQRKDGSLVPISLTVSPVKNGRGKIVGASKVARDITQRRAAEEAFQASLALQDQFLSLVSHELRTPLATVVGNAQLLLRRGDRLAPSSQRDALTDIVDQAERLQGIVDDLLVLTQLTASERIPLGKTRLDVLVGEVVELREATGDREYLLSVEGSTPTVDAAETLIRIVCQNLLANADKYAPPGTPIEVTLSTDEDWVTFSVADRGPGVPPDDVERIFEPFYRAEATRAEVPGMGLGLAVCRRAIEAQKGWIDYEPRPGGGSIFRFALRPATAA